jgi:hypothetical protein
VDGDLVVRTPWSPGSKLSPAARDSAVRFALSGKGRAMVVKATIAYHGAPPYQKVVEPCMAPVAEAGPRTRARSIWGATYPDLALLFGHPLPP